MESTEVIVRPSSEVFVLPEAEDLRHQLKKIKEFQDIVHSCLDEGQDFGVIPGTEKPTLLKPGAEKIAKILGLSEHYELVDSTEDWTKPFFNYHFKCKLVHMGTGVQVAECEGSCNSYESKYRYRNSQRLCPNCGKEAIIPGKKEYGGGYICWKKKGGCEAKFEDNDARITGQVVGKVENDDIFSVVNTLQKMAQKRAFIGATLSAGRLSNVFTQDIEDMPGFGEIEKPEMKQQPPLKAEKPKNKTEKPAEKPAEKPPVNPPSATGGQPAGNTESESNTGDLPPFDQPAGANREPAKGSDAWIAKMIKETGVKEAGLTQYFVSSFKIPLEKIDQINMANNIKLLTADNKASLTVLLETKAKQIADAKAAAEKL
jgi:hypothetical protein